MSSRLDFTVLHALRARRAARDPSAARTLALLRRLRERPQIETLPETRVEQSWNEQLFAGILGYRTLLSHDALPFHVLPKNLAGPRRYDDFSLGFFGADVDVVLGTAELKTAGTDLDKPQTSGNYNGQTPVQQALTAARAHGPPCRWVLVSNFCALRLYDLRDPAEPLFVVHDLREVRNPDDLALLRAHLDVAALLGDHGKQNAEMPAALDPNHLARPLPPSEGHCRIVLRFALGADRILPLFRIEKAARHASVALEGLPGFATRSSNQLHARDGWVAADAIFDSIPPARLAASRFGELQLSVAVPAPRKSVPVEPTRIPPQIDSSPLVAIATAFTTAIDAFYRVLFSSSETIQWRMSAELREVEGVRLTLREMQDMEASPEGECPTADISTGDFEGTGASASPLASAAAACLNELAVHFRGERGGVGFDERQLQTRIEQALSQR